MKIARLPHELTDSGWFASLANVPPPVAPSGRIRCDWSEEGKIHGAATANGGRQLESLAEALGRIGEPCEWYDRATMQAITGTGHYRQGLFAPGTVLLQPAAYLRGLADALVSRIEVYEDSPVTEVRHGDATHTCTVDGAEIEARNLVLANNAFLSQFGFHGGEVIPVYTYASLTRPLSDAEVKGIPGRGTFGLVPADRFGTTLRRTADRRIFVRNTFHHVPGFRIGEAHLARAKARHQRSLAARYPEIADIGFEHSWGGCLGLSQNGGAVFGEIGDRVFAAAVCNGIGIARGTAFGKALAELATGQESPVIEMLLRRPKPARTVPRFLLGLGVRWTIRYRGWRAGAET